MTLQVQEITNFNSGIDVSLDPILSPPDAFVDLNNGFVFRGVLQSRTGYRHFANGISPSTRLVSRLADEVTSENVGNTANSAEQTFTLANTQVERTVITISVAAAAKTLTLTYDPTDGTTTVGGNSGVGTNEVNYQTGDITVTFDAVLAAGNPITVTYNYPPDRDWETHS